MYRNIEERDKWNAFYASTGYMREYREIKSFGEEFVRYVEELLPSGGSVLEAGCGAGFQSLALARLAKYDISLLDFSTEALKVSVDLFKREGLGAEFHDGDVFTEGQPEYDLVFNNGSLEHYEFEKQVEFVRGLKSRSKKYVLVLVPNGLCYWYWLWRVQKIADKDWPFGREVPLVDLSGIFKEAGVSFLGQTFMGESWTESFIRSVKGINGTLRSQAMGLHRSPAVPKDQKCYIVAALGAVRDGMVAPECWRPPVFRQEAREAESITETVIDMAQLTKGKCAFMDYDMDSGSFPRKILSVYKTEGLRGFTYRFNYRLKRIMNRFMRPR